MSFLRRLFSRKSGDAQKSGAMCRKCGSRIDHFGFTGADGIRALSMNSDTVTPEEYDGWMRTVGGKCPGCGVIYCSLCYREQGGKCSQCRAALPAELSG